MTPNEHIMMSELFKCSYMNNTTKEKCNNSIIFCLDLIQDFQIKTDSVDSLSSLNSLWRLLHRTVGVEGLKLLLDSGQRVGQFTVIQNNDGLLYPRQQVWGQRLVLFDHLLRLDGLIQNLGQRKHSGIETLELIADVTASTSPFQLSFPRRPAVSSWRSSGRMPPRRWWWTSHLGSLWTHLHNKAREELPVKARNIAEGFSAPSVTYLQGPTVWSHQAFVLLHWRRCGGCGWGWTSSECHIPTGPVWSKTKEEDEWQKSVFTFERESWWNSVFSPVFVYESVEGHAVFPAGGEVGDVDVGVSAIQQPVSVTDRTFLWGSGLKPGSGGCSVSPSVIIHHFLL